MRAEVGQRMGNVFVGIAGWALPSASYRPGPGFAPRLPLERFGEDGSHLERYARVYPAVEINSTFYRPHRAATFARWARAVPPAFRFAVKLSREITHERRLADAAEPLARFLAPVRELGTTLGPLLVQLPPSLAFSSARAEAFFEALRAELAGPVVLEARHPSWFEAPVASMLARHRVGRVIADPSPVPRERMDQDAGPLVYVRLHGAPRMYWSGYSDTFLEALAHRIAALRERAEVWCIFDNTAAGFAHHDALSLLDLLALLDRARARPL